jgi:hypothetical protein
MTRFRKSKKLKDSNNISGVLPQRVSYSVADLVETALRNMGLDPDDRNMPTPDPSELTEALNAEYSKRTLRKSN